MGRSNKLFSKHRGPYQVSRRKQSIYIIEDLVLGKQIKTQVHNLQPFLFNPNQVNPLEVAQQNEQEFMVRYIIAHRTMDRGYDASSNSWELYKALMHVDKLHEYLRQHKMRSLIPREHILPDIFPIQIVFPLRFLVSKASHTSEYLLRVSCKPHSYFGISLASFRASIDPTSKRRGTVNTYCTTVRTILSHLHVLLTVHIVHVPCFPVSDVEVSSSTSVRALVHTYYNF